MLSLCLTSYSLGKDLPETNGGSFLLSIILALKNKINSNIKKNYLQMKTMNGAQFIILTFRTASFFLQYTQSHCALLWQKNDYHQNIEDTPCCILHCQ